MFEYSVDESGILTFRCVGTVTLTDALNATGAASSDAAIGPPRLVLWDEREASFDFGLDETSSPQFKSWIERINRAPLNRLAILVGSNMHRVMDELVVEQADFESDVRVFEDHDAARDWLLGEEPA